MANTACISTKLGSLRILRARNGWIVVAYGGVFDPSEMPVEMVAETPERLGEIIMEWAGKQASEA